MTYSRNLSSVLRSLFVTAMGVAAAYAPGELAADGLKARPDPVRLEPAALDYANTMASRVDELLEVFVQLDMSSVGEYVMTETKAGRGRPNQAQQKKHYRAVEARQAEMRAVLKSYGARELSALQVGANGFRIKINAREIAAITKLPGVRSVARVQLFTPDLVESVPWVGAPDVWADLGITGEGVTIAVIDTGIDYTHANLGGSGDPADYASNDPNVIEPGTFPTAKVTFGWDFVGTNFDAGDPANDVPMPDPDPLDENFHGSHVAGDAAGLGVEGSVGPGVARGAELWALKVFGVSGSTNVTSDAIELALDPNQDGSVDDHVDVINMSLGSPLGDPDSPSAIAAQTAAELGVIVVISAGNSGDTPYITGAPAVAPAAISVAASIPGNRLEASFEVTAPAAESGFFPVAEGAGPVRVADVAPLSGTLVPAEPLLGCDPLTNPAEIAGNIALIVRGACFFNTKYLNAQAAGAKAIVVFNDGANAGRVDPIVMGGISGAVTIPGVMISSTKGFSIHDAIVIDGATVEVTLDVAPNVGSADTLAGFSSRGPGHGGSAFKPDVTAPGSSIVSTGFATGTGAINSSGTSFSAPHVAGEAALLRAIHPDLDPAGIKAIVQNATVTAHVDGLGGVLAYPVARQGTGVIQVNSAAHLSSFAAPGGVSFGRVNPSKDDKVKVKVEVHNLTSDKREFTIAHIPGQTFPGVTVASENPTVKVPANGSKKFTLELAMDPSVGPADPGGFTQTEVDGWFVLDDGVDQLRVGYLAVVDPASDMAAEPRDGGQLRVRNKRGSAGFAEGFTLIGKDGDLLNKVPNAIEAFGFRNSNFGFPAVEFGVTTERPWETASAYEIDILIDADGDGDFETTLVAADLGLLQGNDATGEIVTAIFSPTAASLLFFADGDLNDSSIVLPFIRQDFGLGFLPPGDSDFDYVLAVFDIRSGSVDIQSGSVDLADEIVPEHSSLVLNPDEELTMATSGGPGQMLWLFQNNNAKKQGRIVTVE